MLSPQFPDLPDYLSGYASNLVRGPTLEFAHHVEVVTAADWLSQGSQVVTASWDRTASLADAETGEQVSALCGKYFTIKGQKKNTKQ